MGGARRHVGMVEVIGLHAVGDEGAHQVGERLGIVVDAAQQHGLADERDAGIGEEAKRPLGIRRELAGVVGVDRDIDRLAGRAEGAGIVRRDALGRHTGTGCASG